MLFSLTFFEFPRWIARLLALRLHPHRAVEIFSRVCLDFCRPACVLCIKLSLCFGVSEDQWSSRRRLKGETLALRVSTRVLGGSWHRSANCWGLVLTGIHRWKRPRMRCRRLRTSSTDPRRPRGDLRTTNRQDSIGAAVMAGPSMSRHQEIIFFGPH